MSPVLVVVLVALAAFAVYRQSRRHEVTGPGRFRLAIGYAVVGLAVGVFSRPDTPVEWALLGGSLALGLGVGLARGRLTRLTTEDGLRVFARGTPLTVGLFLGMIAVKVGLGTWAHLAGVSDDGGFGEILLMIGLMVAFQAEVLWRRARQVLRGPASARTPDR